MKIPNYKKQTTCYNKYKPNSYFIFNDGSGKFIGRVTKRMCDFQHLIIYFKVVHIEGFNSVRVNHFYETSRMDKTCTIMTLDEVRLEML